MFALSGCVRVGVCVLACVRSLGGGGAWFAPPPLHAHCPLAAWAFGAHAPRVGGFGVCDAPLGAGVTASGVGQRCPAPYSVACAARLLRGAQEKGCGCSHGVLTRARAQRDGGEGSRVGRTVVAWLGAGALAYRVGE